MKIHVALSWATALAALCVACGSDDGGSGTGGSGGAGASGGTAGAGTGGTAGTGGAASSPCEQDCDQQAAAGCAKTPAGYADSCKLLCQATKSGLPTECHDEFDAQYTCALTKISYSCVKDVVTAAPSGACAAEGAACASCAGKACLAAF